MTSLSRALEGADRLGRVRIVGELEAYIRMPSNLGKIKMWRMVLGLLTWAGMASAQDTAGEFDYYVLSLSWSAIPRNVIRGAITAGFCTVFGRNTNAAIPPIAGHHSARHHVDKPATWPTSWEHLV